jgi:hypothetical protein
MITKTRAKLVPIKHADKHTKLKAIKKAQLDFLHSSYNLINDSTREKVVNLLEREFTKIETSPESDECTCDFGEHVDVNFSEAIAVLSDGHGAISPNYATAVYTALGLEFNKKLIYHGYSDVFNFKGLHMADGQEGTLTVNTGDMSFDIADKLGVKESAGSYNGRGFQARAYAVAIHKKLKGE